MPTPTPTRFVECSITTLELLANAGAIWPRFAGTSAVLSPLHCDLACSTPSCSASPTYTPIHPSEGKILKYEHPRDLKVLSGKVLSGEPVSGGRAGFGRDTEGLRAIESPESLAHLSGDADFQPVKIEFPPDPLK